MRILVPERSTRVQIRVAKSISQVGIPLAESIYLAIKVLDGGQPDATRWGPPR